MSLYLRLGLSSYGARSGCLSSSMFVLLPICKLSLNMDMVVKMSLGVCLATGQDRQLICNAEDYCPL